MTLAHQSIQVCAPSVERQLEDCTQGRGRALAAAPGPRASRMPGNNAEARGNSRKVVGSNPHLHLEQPRNPLPC